MTTEIKKGKTATLRLNPPSRWTGSIAGVVLSDQNVEMETVTPSLDTVDTTVAEDVDNTSSRIKLASVVGIVRAGVYQITSDSWGTALAKVAAVDDDGSFVKLTGPLPSTPEAGDAWQGFQVIFGITTESTSTAGKNRRAVATSGDEEVLETIHVMEHPWAFPISTREIREYMADNWAGDPRIGNEEWVVQVQESADEELRGRLSEAGRYAFLYFNGAALRRAAWPCVKLALLWRKLRPTDRDVDNYEQHLTFEIRDRVAGLLKSLEPYDANEDAKVGTDEVGPFAAIVRTR